MPHAGMEASFKSTPENILRQFQGRIQVWQGTAGRNAILYVSAALDGSIPRELERHFGKVAFGFCVGLSEESY